MDICQDYEAKINNTFARLFPVMDQTSLIWRKKIKAMEKVELQSPVYPLMTTTKYLHALDILYEDQEWEMKMQTAKLKEHKLKYER